VAQLNRIVITASTACALTLAQSGHSQVRSAAHQPIVMSVKDFGALGNGVADDTDRIRAALAALSVGGRLSFPSGVYRISSEIAIEKDGVFLDFQNATVTTNLNVSMIRFGATSSSDKIYKGQGISGRLSMQGAGSGNGNNTCLTIRNVSYGHFAASVSLTNCGGVPFLFGANKRGVQHNYVGGGWEITGNPGGSWSLQANGTGGYINDNTFQAIRAHRNGSGGLTQARLTGQTLHNNIFIGVAVETHHPNDQLLAIEAGSANNFIGLRLDGVSKTRALEIASEAKGNIFIGLALDGTAHDQSNSSVFISGISAQPSRSALSGSSVERRQVAKFRNADAKPSVSTGNVFLCVNSVRTTITAFTNLIDGHQFTVIMDSNTTIQHSPSIRMANGIDFAGRENNTITFVSVGGVAYEISRSING
jgi:hypothetical protein